MIVDAVGNVSSLAQSEALAAGEIDDEVAHHAVEALGDLLQPRFQLRAQLLADGGRWLLRAATAGA